MAFKKRPFKISSFDYSEVYKKTETLWNSWPNRNMVWKFDEKTKIEGIGLENKSSYFRFFLKNPDEFWDILIDFYNKNNHGMHAFIRIYRNKSFKINASFVTQKIQLKIFIFTEHWVKYFVTV